jgi:uncharacterized DUF497 family protein
VKITYDPNKRDWTLQVRGLDFEHASEIFAGDQFERQSDARDYGEPRFVTAGYLQGRMVVVVWTPRGDARHIISMRFAHAKEEKRWKDAAARRR